MIELPDPRDRLQAWSGDDPAYLAHYRTTTGSEVTPPQWHGLVGAYSEAIPTLAALKLLADLSPLVEVGAGSGYWARLLQDLGADVVAYDVAAPEANSWTARMPGWTDVREGDAHEAIDRHPDRSLFACWPPRPHGYMDDALSAYRGSALALITDGRFSPGEGQPDPLYDVLEREWALDRQLDLPHWPGRHDRLMIWRRSIRP